MKPHLLVILSVIFFYIGHVSTTGVKSQLVRLIDIFVYGPFLIWLSLREKEQLISIILLFMGTTTISYNLKNYIQIRKEKDKTD